MDKIKGIEISECIERIVQLFWYDTITLLDCVLTDDQNEPEYSANIVMNRLQEVFRFQTLYLGLDIIDISDLLIRNGYTKNDIDLLNKKCQNEIIMTGD